MSKGKGRTCGALVHCYLILLTFWLSCSAAVHAEGAQASCSGPLVKKEERRPVVSTEYGEISAVRIDDAINGSYLLHFFSLEPNSLLLPLVLNADMVFYVRAGRGRLSWSEGDEVKQIELRRGDVYRLLQGTVFYIITESEQEQQQRLKINAIFPNSNDDLREPAAEPYSSIQEMVLSFDRRILQATFKVSEEVIDELLGGAKPPAITNADQFCRGYPRRRSCDLLQMNKKKDKKEKKEKEKEEEKEKETGKKHERLFNLFEEEKAVENCYGWSTTVTEKQLPALQGSNIALFMVNLTAGSMMEPHWNTMDTEIGIVLEGRGMVRVSAPRLSNTKDRGGRNWSYEVEEGDVFAVPRFHPTAEMAFNNGSLVFMGFSRISERNKAQFIAGEDSVLQVLDRDVLQILFNVRRTTLDQILSPREDSIISACISCAEEEMRIMEERGDSAAGRHGGEEEREREEETGGRRGRGEERREEREEEREEERRREEREEEREKERRREEREEESREGGGEWEPERQNQHRYKQGGRRIFIKRWN